MNIPLFRPSKPTKKKSQTSTKLPPATTTNVKITEATTSVSGQNRKSLEKPSKKNTLFDDISDDEDEADILISKSRFKSNPVLETKKKEPVKKPTKGNKGGLILIPRYFQFFGPILKKMLNSFFKQNFC